MKKNDLNSIIEFNYLNDYISLSVIYFELFEF